MFYTYTHATPEGRIFYIGKGQGRRAYKFINRNNYWNHIVEKYGKPKVDILAYWDSSEEALEHEKVLIACFKDMGYKLANLTDGGEGVLGFSRPISEEHKAKISAKLKGRPGVKPTPETLEKLKTSHLGQKAWNKGLKGVVKNSQETIEKRAAKLRGKIYNAKFKYIGTNLIDGSTIEFIGNNSMKNAGFDPGRIRDCSNKKKYRLTYKSYTWCKELLKDKLC